MLLSTVKSVGKQDVIVLNISEHIPVPPMAGVGTPPSPRSFGVSDERPQILPGGGLGLLSLVMALLHFLLSNTFCG